MAELIEMPFGADGTIGGPDPPTGSVILRGRGMCWTIVKYIWNMWLWMIVCGHRVLFAGG